MKLKTDMPDGSYSVPARYKNSSAVTNVDVVVVDGHVVTGQEAGAALLDYDKDTQSGRFEYVNDDMTTEEPTDFRNMVSVEPPSEAAQEPQEGAAAEAEGEPAAEGGEAAPVEAEDAPAKSRRGR